MDQSGTWRIFRDALLSSAFQYCNRTEMIGLPLVRRDENFRLAGGGLQVVRLGIGILQVRDADLKTAAQGWRS